MTGEIITRYAQAGLDRSTKGLLSGPPTTKSLWGEMAPVLLVLGIILALGLVLFLVVYWWKRKDDGGGVVDTVAPHSHHRGKRRKRLRAHRPRNPTLAQTGGLPPLREDGPPPAQP